MEHVLDVRLLPGIIEHVSVDPVMVGVRQRIDVIVETSLCQMPTHDLRLGRQTAHARREALAGNDVALARVVGRQEVERRQDGDARLGGRQRPGDVATERGVEEAGPGGVQVVAEIVSSSFVE